jgi:RNA polymerase sigma-70 factor (ECF subfamily)
MQQKVRQDSDTEREWVRLAQCGDASAQKTIYIRYVRYLTAVCARYVSHDEDLKDVLQDSFVKIFLSIDRFEYRGDGSLKAWMTRIVVNEALKFLGREARFASVANPQELPEIVDDDGDPDGMEDVSPEIIQELIRALPVGYRTVFNLYMIEGRSHREIASLLNIGESTSASQLHRAKAILARQIREYSKNTITVGQ